MAASAVCWFVQRLPHGPLPPHTHTRTHFSVGAAILEKVTCPYRTGRRPSGSWEQVERLAGMLLENRIGFGKAKAVVGRRGASCGHRGNRLS